MAGLVHRRSIAWAAALALPLAALSFDGRGAEASASASCQGIQQPITAGTTPVLFVHGIESSYKIWTSKDVAGTGTPPLTYVQDALGSKVTAYTYDWSASSGVAGPVAWVTEPPSPDLGTRLAKAIACLARKAGHQVIVVAHSMGGLITEDASSLEPSDIRAVFTLGTPFQGSWLASAAVGQGPGGGLGVLAQALGAACAFPAVTGSGVLAWCPLIKERDDPGVAAMRLSGGPNGGWTSLPHWPSGLAIYHLGGNIQGIWQPVWPLSIQEPFTGAGDGVVSATSELDGGSGQTLSCPVRIGLGSTLGTPVALSALDLFGATQCFHTQEPYSKTLLDDIISTIQQNHMVPTPAVATPGTVPALYVHNGIVLGALYRYPAFPTSIGLDNHDFIAGIQWANVTPSGATANGTLSVDNCTPDCASGTSVLSTVQLLLSDPQHCTVNVYKQHSDVAKPKNVYVYNKIFVKVLSGNPPASLVGTTSALPPACGNTPASTGPTGGKPKTPRATAITITSATTYQKGALVYFSISYSDPANNAQGFGFVGINGSGWAEETHPFSSPSYGIVGPNSIDYPFNLGCGTPQQISESDVAAWIYGTEGIQSKQVVIHLTCQT
jgi:pimeloyl-ACP methyl ester carboxylesterase